jgi:DNA-binding NarL/FixJ family response regulator
MKAAALMDDLFFSSKISAVARERGVPLAVGRSAESVPADATLVFVDLDAASFDAVAAIEQLKTGRSVKVVAFVAHVHVELKQRAEQAGADIVLPRSLFVQRLPELINNEPSRH